MFKNYVTKGTVSAALALFGLAAVVFGKPQLAAYFNDPATAVNVLTGLTAVFTVVAGVTKGIEAKK